jgi:hypothetical protein
VGKGEGEAVRIKLMRQDGNTIDKSVNFGEIDILPILDGEACKIDATSGKGLSLGKGKEKRIEATITGGALGLIIDARGRPLTIPDKKDIIKKWAEALSPSGTETR